MGLRGPPVAGPDGEDVDTTKQLDHIWRSHCLVGFIVLVFGAVLAITVGWAVSTLEEQQWESDFDNTASALISSMSKAGDESVGHMHLVSAAIRGANNLTRGDLATPCGTLSRPVVPPDIFATLAAPVMARNQFITNVEFAPHLRSDAERAEWEAYLKCVANRTVPVRESRDKGSGPSPAGSAPYFPITFIEPWDPNNFALGLNIDSSEVVRRPNIQRSAESLTVTATPPINLIRGGRGVLLDLVVAPAPTSSYEDDSVLGVLISVLEVSRLVESAIAPELARSPGVAVSVTDITSGVSLYSSLSEIGEPVAPSLVREATIPFATHTWRLRVVQVDADALFPFPNWLLSFIISVLTLLAVGLVVSRARVSVAATVEVGAAAMAAAEHVYRQIIQYICHEVRNPIHAAVGSLNEVEQQLIKQAPQLRGEDGETVLTDLRNGIAAISQLTRVVDDVMAMRKDYNTKQLTIRPRVVDNFSTVLRDLGNQYRAIVMSNVQLVVSAPPSFPPSLFDVSRLRQLLGNGVHNASKHTNAGSVALHSRMLRFMGEDPWVLCIVTNTTTQKLPGDVVRWNAEGEEEDREAFGSSFDSVLSMVRAHTHEESMQTGTVVRITGNPQSRLQKRVERYLTLRGSTGMGLPMCRDIARAMGGFMGVEHAPQRGVTVFWVAVPFPAARGSSSMTPTHQQDGDGAGAGDRAGAGDGAGAGVGAGVGAGAGLGAVVSATSSSSANATTTSHPKILSDDSTDFIEVTIHGTDSKREPGGVCLPVVVVVDDERTIRKLAQRWLKRAGYDVRVACNGQEAVAAVRDAPECVGVMMDIVMMPMDGVEACTTLRSHGCVVPVVAMTSNCAQADIERYRLAGFNGLLPKPFKAAHIVEAVQFCQAASRPPTKWWQSRGNIHEVEPENAAAVLVVDDDRVSRRLAQRWVKRTGLQAVVASTGSEALTALASNPQVAGVMLDLNMAPMDGFEVCKRIRAQGLEIPVVAVTGSDDPDTRRRVQEAGFSGMLPKPASAASVGTWCKSLPPPPAPAATPAPTPAEPTPADATTAPAAAE